MSPGNRQDHKEMETEALSGIVLPLVSTDNRVYSLALLTTWDYQDALFVVSRLFKHTGPGL